MVKRCVNFVSKVLQISKKPVFHSALDTIGVAAYVPNALQILSLDKSEIC